MRRYSHAAYSSSPLTQGVGWEWVQLKLTALSSKREALVDGLSRGMKQRLCLARALMHDPKLLILDEPTSGMDPRARAQMRDILKEIGQMGKTVLISSHILPELSELCTSMTILEKGRLIYSGSMQALSRRMNSAPLEIRFERAMEAEQAQKAMAALEEALGAAPVKLDAACWQVDAQREAADDARALSALVGAEELKEASAEDLRVLVCLLSGQDDPASIAKAQLR